ncbi:MAG: FtsX-like permease family protein [Nitrospirae bacterium]|nr:MAG: FtsX-like permease family protein [Nitrospirota bacterium]
MDIIETARVSLESLRANRMRSLLTMLGVVIGVAAVILLVSIGEGARKYIRRSLGELGTNILIVVPGKTAKEGGMHMGTSSVRKLVYDDALLIKRRSRSIEYAVPVMVGTSWVKFSERKRDTYIVGVTDEYFPARNLNIAFGRAFRPEDVQLKRRVCVLGRTVRHDLFGEKNPLGASIRIGDARFRVVGIMEKKGVTLGYDLDDVVFIPTTVAKELFDTDALLNITVRAKKESLVQDAKREIRDVLRRRHAGREDFTIMSQDEMLDVMGKILNIMTAVLSGIAAISLLVGGIGIMNIMLVSVRERTREIGIRKAIGARRMDIMIQFLTESTLLSLTGGMAGVLIGAVVSWLIPRFITFLPAEIAWWSILLAFVFSAFVGIFFGVYPAKKAAEYDPIVALRYE